MGSLLLRPGRLIRDYIEGRRARHVKPLTLLLVSGAAVVLVGRFTAGGDLIGSARQAGGDLVGNPDQVAIAAHESMKAVQAWANRNFAAMTLLMLPLEALALRLAFHRVGGLNYSEWLVVATFLTAQSFLFWMGELALRRWVPAAVGWGDRVLACLPAVRAGPVLRRLSVVEGHAAWHRRPGACSRLRSRSSPGWSWWRPERCAEHGSLKRNARRMAGVCCSSYFSALKRRRLGPASSPSRRFLSSSYSR
ncbi:DUF3667 domain-containing protein [Stenotrophomonas sp. Marseille-Q4652]|uniref:DUF3667 domain-containing protein n=1 Tax=Stenotrophomonas sp. Marseille-Q4652 TaxID=2866595 RepID=UPI00298F0734|nr:DUF3667 domain-containing protein [Stenotrophomonas sp. Marseille-Q4652]